MHELRLCGRPFCAEVDPSGERRNPHSSGPCRSLPRISTLVTPCTSSRSPARAILSDWGENPTNINSSIRSPSSRVIRILVIFTPWDPTSSPTEPSRPGRSWDTNLMIPVLRFRATYSSTRDRSDREIRAIAVAPRAWKYSPAPEASQRAAAIQRPAAVVRPRTVAPSRKMVPAPRKPIPLTTWAAIRAGSLCITPT